MGQEGKKRQDQWREGQQKKTRVGDERREVKCKEQTSEEERMTEEETRSEGVQ